MRHSNVIPDTETFFSQARIRNRLATVLGFLGITAATACSANALPFRDTPLDHSAIDGGDAAGVDAGSGTGGGSQDSIYAKRPNIQNCIPGRLTEAEQDRYLEEVNRVRALHELPPVVRNGSFDKNTQSSALITAANNQLDHKPPFNRKCFSNGGYQGSGESNLYIATLSKPFFVTTDAAIAAFFIDAGVPSLGHRRRMLSPGLTCLSVGRVDGKVPGTDLNVTAISQQVKCKNKHPMGDIPDFVAYPFGKYPGKYFEPGVPMSLSVIADKKSLEANGCGDPHSAVDYRNVVIQVFDDRRRKLPVTEIKVDCSLTENHIQWVVPNTKDNITYTVEVTGVMVKIDTTKTRRHQYKWTFSREP